MVATGDSPLDNLFHAVVDIIHNLPASGPVKVTNDEKLTYYGLYKQATEGPCTKPKPGFWNVIEGYKWDAWNKLGDKDSEESKQEYIDLVRKKIREVSKKYKVSEWMGGDDWDRLEPVMLPKFKLLDPELVKQWGFHEGGPGRDGHVNGDTVKENGEVVNGDQAEKPEEDNGMGGEEGKENEVVYPSQKQEEVVDKSEAEVPNYLSDDDYCDAEESVDLSGKPTKKGPYNNLNLGVCGNFEKMKKTVSVVL
uniref:ACB domain-containing protein n=1 Tax=Steinernema glaseri TaxID=37863 RepID=A0A1I7XWS5_9BILA